jgi:hypothetical protein
MKKNMKRCIKCALEKDLSEFRAHPQTKDKLQSWCKACTQVVVDANRKRCPRTSFHYQIKRKYGITIDDYERMLEDQGGGCAICGETNPLKGKNYLCVDHCHTTGKVRGILCHDCNTGLGKFKDSEEFLRTAINYLST